MKEISFEEDVDDGNKPACLILSKQNREDLQAMHKRSGKSKALCVRKILDAYFKEFPEVKGRR